jgi:hypothetical protein
LIKKSLTISATTRSISPSRRMITLRLMQSIRKWAASATKIRGWGSILSAIPTDTGSRSFRKDKGQNP